MNGRKQLGPTRTTLVLLALTATLAPAWASTRPAALLETMAVEGVTLDTPARAAFEGLIARGYTSAYADYDAWWHPVAILHRGDANDPEGRTEIQLGRVAETGELVSIIASTERLRASSYDGASEIAPARGHFSIPVDESTCASTPTAAQCGVQSTDRDIAYLLVSARVTRYEAVQRMNVLPTAGDRPDTPSTTRPDAHFDAAEKVPVPRLPNPNWEPCSLAVMSEAVQPLLTETELEKQHIVDKLAARASTHRTLMPDHFAESRVSIRGGDPAANLVWCTTPFAVSDVEWMNDHGLVDPLPKLDEIVDRAMPEAVAETGLSESQIRDILEGSRPSGASDAQIYRLYQFAKEVSRRELAREVSASNLVFYLFSPNAATDYVGMIGPLNLNRPQDVSTRHAGVAGWPQNAEANLLVSLAPPAAPSAHVATEIRPGSRHRAFAHAHPQSDDLLDRSHPSARGAQTATSLYSLYEGDFVRFQCDGEQVTAFQGQQRAYWGYLEGEFVVASDWDPASGFVRGDLQLDGEGELIVTNYHIYEQDDPDCRYRTEVVDEEPAATTLSFGGEVRAPNRVDVPRLPGLKGRPVQVGPR